LLGLGSAVGTPGETLPEDEMEDGEGGAISCKRELCGCQGVCMPGGDKVELIGTFFTATHETNTMQSLLNTFMREWLFLQ
jgi:hypothetical protein